MSCMYPRKKMKPVKSKKETLKKLVIIGTLFTVNMGLLMASPTIFKTLNNMEVEAYDDSPFADVTIYKDKTPYGTCEYVVVEAKRADGGVAITPRMKPSDNQNGSKHICRKASE